MAKKLSYRQRRIVQGAVNNLRNALIDKGIDANTALRFARIALSAEQGTRIGRGGSIHFKGKTYGAKDFADTKFIDYVTGERAKQANARAIQADPAYQSTMAQAGLDRDQLVARDDNIRRQNLIDSGYAEFVQGDPVLQAAVANNPFSNASLEKTAYERNQAHGLQDAQNMGTRFGGGYQAALQEALRVHAGNESNQTSSLQNTLSQLLMEQTQARQQYDTTHANALLQGQQTLTANGTAVQPPKLQAGGYHWFTPPKPPGGGGGSAGGNAGGPRDAPGSGGPPHIAQPPGVAPGHNPTANPPHGGAPGRPIPLPPAPYRPPLWHHRRRGLLPPPPPRRF